MRSVGLKVQMQQSVFIQNTVVGAATTTARSFKLSDFAAVSNFTALFDRYRILKLEVWIIGGAATSTTGSIEGGTYVTAIDVDDAASPAAYSSVQRMQGANETSILCGHYHAWQPCSALFAFPVATYQSAPLGSWIDCSSPGVDYYGLKFAFGGSSTSIPMSMIVRATVEFEGIETA